MKGKSNEVRVSSKASDRLSNNSIRSVDISLNTCRILVDIGKCFDKENDISGRE